MDLKVVKKISVILSLNVKKIKVLMVILIVTFNLETGIVLNLAKDHL